MASTLTHNLAVTATSDVASDLGVTGSPGGRITSTGTLTAGTTPVVDTTYSKVLALTAGALTISLNALTRNDQATLNLTGKEIFTLTIKNRGANVMTFTDGAVNGYDIGEIIVGPNGGVAHLVNPAGFGAVGAADLAIDVAGTGAQTFEIIIGAGPTV
jgi:hypothetical protein